jgi:hypothetical protein
MRLRVEYEFHRTGPGHAGRYQGFDRTPQRRPRRRHQAGRSRNFRPQDARKQDVSATVLRVLDRFSSSSLARELDGAIPREAGLARFVLVHQAAVLATASVPLPLQPRWAGKELFGLHLDTSVELLNWTGDVDSLLDSRNTMGTLGPRM